MATTIVVLSLLLFAVLILLFKVISVSMKDYDRLLDLSSKHDLLIMEKNQLRNQIVQRDAAFKILKSTLDITLKYDEPQQPVTDEKTMMFIQLAVNNTNDNEARNAAMKACKRIYAGMQDKK